MIPENKIPISYFTMLTFLKNIFKRRTAPDLSAILITNPTLVDVRSADEFQSGSVEGAIHIPLQNLIDQTQNWKKDKSIVVFCRSGSRSSIATLQLRRNGFSAVVNGGSWQHVQLVLTNLNK